MYVGILCFIEIQKFRFVCNIFFKVKYGQSYIDKKVIIKFIFDCENYLKIFKRIINVINGVMFDEILGLYGWLLVCNI